jgi:hypothetical protein
MERGMEMGMESGMERGMERAIERNTRAEADFSDFAFVRGALVACGLSAMIWLAVWMMI